MTGGPPDRLNHRHHLAALLEATTPLTLTQIAAKIRMSPIRLGIVRKAPAYQAQVEQYRAQLVREKTFDVVAAMREIEPEVFDRKLQLMRQRDNLAVAAQQADSFFDRFAPPRRQPQPAGVGGVVRVAISVDEVARLRAVAVEAGHVIADGPTPAARPA